MLKLTVFKSINNGSPDENTSSYLFSKKFKSTFASATPYTLKKDIWDFGDKIIIGNRKTNSVQLWEAIERTAAEVDIDTGAGNLNKEEIYIDVFNSTNETGFGPCIKTTTECMRYDTEDGLVALETDDESETLLISLKNPEAVEDIYNNLEYFLQDTSFSQSKYDWIGSEMPQTRSLYVSRRGNEKKKKELLAKTPRIALTAVANNNRKRG